MVASSFADEEVKKVYFRMKENIQNACIYSKNCISDFASKISDLTKELIPASILLIK